MQNNWEKIKTFIENVPFYDIHIESMPLEKANEFQFCLCHN